MASAMLLPAHVVGLWLAIVIVLVLGTRALLPHRRSVVVCPRTRFPALVDVDGYLAIEACSRLPSALDCDHGCLPQLQFSTEGVGTFLAAKKCCTICGGALNSDDWYASRPAAGAASSEQLAASEGGHVICWRCYQACSA